MKNFALDIFQYKDDCRLGCGATWCGRSLKVFGKNVLPLCMIEGYVGNDLPDYVASYPSRQIFVGYFTTSVCLSGAVLNP
jgi:hypothetical protein